MRTYNPRVPLSSSANQDVVLQSFYQQRKNRPNNSSKCHSLLQRNSSYFSNSLKGSQTLKTEDKLQSYPSMQIQQARKQNAPKTSIKYNPLNDQSFDQISNDAPKLNNSNKMQIQTNISRVRAYSQKSTPKNSNNANQILKQTKTKISQRQRHIQQLQNSFKALTAGMPSNKNKKVANIGNYSLSNKPSIDMNNLKSTNKSDNINGMIMQKLQKYMNPSDINNKQNYEYSKNSELNSNINIINKIKPNSATNKNSSLSMSGVSASNGISPSSKSNMNISINKYLKQYNTAVQNRQKQDNTIYKQTQSSPQIPKPKLAHKTPSPTATHTPITAKYQDQYQPLVVLAATNKTKHPQKYPQKYQYNNTSSSHTNNKQNPISNYEQQQQQQQLSIQVQQRQLIKAGQRFNNRTKIEQLDEDQRYNTQERDNQQQQDYNKQRQIQEQRQYSQEYQSPNFKMNQQSYPDQEYQEYQTHANKDISKSRTKNSSKNTNTNTNIDVSQCTLIKKYNTDKLHPTFNTQVSHPDIKLPANAKKQKTSGSMNSNKSSERKQSKIQQKIDKSQKQKKTEKQQKMSQEIEYLKSRVQALEKINKKQTKFIDSVYGMRRIVLQVKQDCNLKELWRWLKALPGGKTMISQEKSLDQ